jgi:hypothetical protein
MKLVSTESRRKSRIDSKISHKPDNMLVAIPKNSNNQIVLHFQGEHFHKSKKINKIMFVWTIRRWKPIFLDASETTEDDVTTLTHVPTK